MLHIAHNTTLFQLTFMCAKTAFGEICWFFSPAITVGGSLSHDTSQLNPPRTVTQFRPETASPTIITPSLTSLADRLPAPYARNIQAVCAANQRANGGCCLNLRHLRHAFLRMGDITQSDQPGLILIGIEESATHQAVRVSKQPRRHLPRP